MNYQNPLKHIKQLLDTNERYLNDNKTHFDNLLKAHSYSITYEINIKDGQFKVVSNIDHVLGR